MEKPKWINPKIALPDFDCYCWCALRYEASVYYYDNFECIRKYEMVDEEPVEFKDGKFCFTDAEDEYGNSVISEELDFERDSAYAWSARKLSGKNGSKKYHYINLAQLEIVAYTIMPDDYEEGENKWRSLFQTVMK